MPRVQIAMSHRAATTTVRTFGIIAATSFLVACSPAPQPVDAAREEAIRVAVQDAASASAMLQFVDKKYYLPAATATGAARTLLLDDAEEGYRKLIEKYPFQTNIAAQALRNLGNVLAEQNRTNRAVAAYSRVSTNYPTADWQILQTTKAAGDLLWSAGRTNDAVPYYRTLVLRYEGRTNEADVIGLVVKGARSRLQEAGETTPH